MEKIVKEGFFFSSLGHTQRMKGRDVQADEKVKEEKFQQNTQVYRCICLRGGAYRNASALRPRLTSPHL